MRQKKNIWVPFLFGFFLINIIQKEVILTGFMNSQEKISSYDKGTENPEDKFVSKLFYESENPLDDCNFVYLDMGTNFGVQIR